MLMKFFIDVSEDLKGERFWKEYGGPCPISAALNISEGLKGIYAFWRINRVEVDKTKKESILSMGVVSRLREKVLKKDQEYLK